MKIGTWILSLVQPLLGKVLASLGFSVVSILGMQAIFSQLRQLLTQGFMGLSPDILNVFLIAGGGEGLGIIVGAMATKLMLWQAQNAVKILGVAPQ
jgi:hypothetical protein